MTQYISLILYSIAVNKFANLLWTKYYSYHTTQSRSREDSCNAQLSFYWEENLECPKRRRTLMLRTFYQQQYYHHHIVCRLPLGSLQFTTRINRFIESHNIYIISFIIISSKDHLRPRLLYITFHIPYHYILLAAFLQKTIVKNRIIHFFFKTQLKIHKRSNS